MSGKKWTMLRVRPATAARLRAEIERILRRHTVNGTPDWLDGEELTADKMIARLLDHADKDRARNERYSQSRKRDGLRKLFVSADDVVDLNPNFIPDAVRKLSGDGTSRQLSRQ